MNVRNPFLAVGTALLLAVGVGAPSAAAPEQPEVSLSSDILPPLPGWIGTSTCCVDCNLLICWCLDPNAYCADCVTKCVKAGKSAVCRIKGWCYCFCEGNAISID